MNKSNRTIGIECWPRYAIPGKDKQYKGWPKTISQFDNYGRKAVAYLPEINVTGATNPVLKIINESTNEVANTVRILGKKHKAKVFEKGSYTIKVTEPETLKEKIIKKVKATKLNEKRVIKIRL